MGKPIDEAKELFSFEKKGMAFKVLGYEGKEDMILFLEHQGCRQGANARNHRKHGWYFEIRKGKIVELILNDKKKGANIVHESAEKANEIQKKYQARKIQEAKKRAEADFRSLTDESPIRIIWGTSFKTLYTDDSTARDSEYMKEALSTLELSKVDIQKVMERKPDDFDWGDYSTTETWKVSFKDFKKILAVAQEILEEKELKRKEQEEKQQKERNAIFAKAKQTGKKQALRSYSVECSDPDEECNIDNVIIYAMPDGSTKKEQHHTW